MYSSEKIKSPALRAVVVLILPALLLWAAFATAQAMPAGTTLGAGAALRMNTGVAPTAPAPAANAAASAARMGTGVAPAAPLAAPVGSGPTVRIGIGDLLDIAVFDAPELSGKVRVDNQGLILLPLLDPIKVQGLSIQEAQNEVAAQLVKADLMKTPQVSINVAEYGIQGIAVLGEVKRPGLYAPLGRRLLEVLSMAEGLLPTASRTVVITHYNNPDQPIHVTLSDDAQSDTTNPVLMPGDTVVVPKTELAFVIGEVSRPGGFPFDNGKMTVLQAVALAGGPTHTAKLQEAKIIRKNDSGVQEIPLPLNKILATREADAALQPGDIIYVPNSLAKAAAGRSLNAIVSAATSAMLFLK
jgi:polysaccharide export outer membrane protein